MRTTVDISEEQHRALTELAHRRGLRGFSVLVQEALDAYLRAVGEQEVNSLPALRGSLSDEAAEGARSRIEAARATWRVS
jgi:hypothetical protein